MCSSVFITRSGRGGCRTRQCPSHFFLFSSCYCHLSEKSPRASLPSDLQGNKLFQNDLPKKKVPLPEEQQHTQKRNVHAEEDGILIPKSRCWPYCRLSEYTKKNSIEYPLLIFDSSSGSHLSWEKKGARWSFVATSLVNLDRI